MTSPEVHALIDVEGSRIVLLPRGTARFEVLHARGTARFEVLHARGTARFDRRDCFRALKSHREARAAAVVREQPAREQPRALTARPRSLVAAARIDQSYRKTVLAFLSFLALSVCGSIHHVANARAVGLSTHADFAESYGDDFELGRPSHAPARYRQDSRVPPGWEIRALESEDTEEEAGLDLPVASPTVGLVAILPVAGPFLRIASVAFIAQLFGSSALPRGPPSIRC